MMTDTFRLLALRNLTEIGVEWVKPWEFQIVDPISDEIRTDRDARQAFYRNPRTRHQFYSGWEGLTTNARINSGKGGNPPHLLHAIVGDYDIALTRDEVMAGITRMGDHKPMFYERSLGGKFRLVWVLDKPLRIANESLAIAFLKRLGEVVPFSRLPELDKPAMLEPNRYFANGGVWERLEHPPISQVELQGLLVEVARKHNWSKEAGPSVPLDVVEKFAREKCPNFKWPGEFKVETQGPSFWVPGSTSPMSAIVKDGGMVTFAAHADRVFYTWADILGHDVVAAYQRKTLGEAIEDIWFENERFWHRGADGYYVCRTDKSIGSYLSIHKGLSTKAEPGQRHTQVELAKEHIRYYQNVIGAGPFPMRPQGRIIYSGKPVLNTWNGKVIQPCPEPVFWGPDHFPLMYEWVPLLLKNQEQFEWMMSYLAWAYRAALKGSPTPGQAVFLMGGQGRGKTLFARQVIGALLGNYIDAGSYFMNNDAFNSHLFEASVWSLDDEIATNDMARRRFLALLKKVVANPEHTSNKKHQSAVQVEWLGRVICTLNCDELSARTLLPTESGIVDKVSYLRTGDDHYPFPNREEIAKHLEIELRRFGRFLVDWTIPERFQGDARYGVVSYFDPEMHLKANQSSESASFFELLTDFLRGFFLAYPDAQEWRGNITTLLRAMSQQDPCSADLIKAYRPEGASRCMATIQSASRLPMAVETDKNNIRVWIFPRTAVDLGTLTSSESMPPHCSTQNPFNN